MPFLKVKNNAESTLASGINASATSLTVASGEGAKFPTDNFHITIDDEILLCTSRSGDTFTVERGKEGTEAAAHDAGAKVQLRWTAAYVEELQTALEGKNTFVTVAPAEELFRRDAAKASPFTATINGTPTSTSVPYTNATGEYSLPDFANPHFGKVILYNSTRGNSRKIVGLDLNNKVITTEASSDNWANGDSITTASAACGSPWFDIDLSAKVPSEATAVLLLVYGRDISGAASSLQNGISLHPYESYSIPKVSSVYANAAYQSNTVTLVVPLIAQKICIGFGLYGTIPSQGMFVTIRLRGYWK